MSLPEASLVSTVALGLVLALMGGWVISEAHAFPRRETPLKLAGVMMFVMSLSLLNRLRLDGIFQQEDALTVVIRTVSVILGIVILWCCITRCGE